MMAELSRFICSLRICLFSSCHWLFLPFNVYRLRAPGHAPAAFDAEPRAPSRAPALPVHLTSPHQQQTKSRPEDVPSLRLYCTQALTSSVFESLNPRKTVTFPQ